MTAGKDNVSKQFDSGFSLGLMRKDLTIAIDLSKRPELKTLLAETLLKSRGDVEVKLGVAADHTEIFRMLDG
jgi:3-hydroxyisobutyrate dehydrogenase